MSVVNLLISINTFGLVLKMKLHKTSKGQYFVLLPDELVRVVKWKEGDEIELIPGSEVAARKEDLVLRKK